MKMRKTFFVLLALFLPVAASAAEDGTESVSKTLVWPDGTRYVGGVVDGKRSGKGTIFWQDGTRFVGQFTNDMRNGPGTMILPDGKVYTGFFKDDELVDSPAESTSAISQVDPVQIEAELDRQTKEIAATQPGTTDIPLVEVEPIKTAPVYEPVTRMTEDATQQLIETIDLWSAAWSEKNVPQYLSNYSDDFVVPGKLSRKSWEGLRRSRLRRPKYIEVTIDYENFDIVQPDIADVYFKQTYRSNTYSDITNKVLRLRKEDHTWMILGERSR